MVQSVKARKKQTAKLFNKDGKLVVEFMVAPHVTWAEIIEHKGIYFVRGLGHSEYHERELYHYADQSDTSIQHENAKVLENLKTSSVDLEA